MTSRTPSIENPAFLRPGVRALGLLGALAALTLLLVACSSADDGGTEAKAAAQAAAAAAEAATKASDAAERASEAAQQAAMASSDTSAAESAAAAAEAATKASDAALKASSSSSMTASDASAALSAAQAAAEAAQQAADAAKQVAESVSMTTMDMDMGPGSLVLYSGRSESLVAPIIQQFENATGIDVEVKYGSTSAIAATIQEEGANSPADVFWAQDPGALGALSGMFTPLPSDVTLAVPEWARASDGRWVGISGRARVIVYNTDLSEDELPKSVQDLTDPKWKGRVGWPPTNASFRVMVTAMRHLWGEDETRSWLEGMIANDVKVFPKNTPIVDAAGKGEVDVGLVNHYYLHRFVAENGDGFGARNLFLNDGGPGSLVMVAGVGRLETSQNTENAEAFVRFLLSKVAQQYFAASTYEYPLIEGVKTHHLLPPIDTLNGPDIDFAPLDDLAGSEALLREVGAIP